MKLWNVTLVFNGTFHYQANFASLDSMNKWMSEMIGTLAKYHSILPDVEKKILQTTITYEISFIELELPNV